VGRRAGADRLYHTPRPPVKIRCSERHLGPRLHRTLAQMLPFLKRVPLEPFCPPSQACGCARSESG